MRKIILIIIFLYSLLYSQSTWFLQNPYPQANPIMKIQAVTSNIIFASGSGKTMIKSTNGGVNWSVYSNNIPDWNYPYGSNISSSWFTGPDTGYFCGSKGVVYKTVNGGVNWTDKLTGLTTDLYAMQFVNPNTGYACGMNGKIIKTTDGGNSWINQNSGGTATLMCIYFISENTGWICGTLLSGNILKTTDGGNNWLPYPCGVSMALSGIQFINSITGYSAGSGGSTIKSTDGGLTWFSIPTGSIADFVCVYFTSAETGYIAGGNSGCVLFKTTNGGTNWTYITGNLPWSTNLRTISFIDANTGWIAGYEGKIGKTTDAGATFTSLSSGLTNAFYTAHFLNDQTGWAAGTSGAMVKTTNGGANWNQITSSIPLYFSTIRFVNSLTGYTAGSVIAGDTNYILKSNDGGLSWFPKLKMFNYNFKSLYMLNDQTGWIAGYKATPPRTGLIMMTINGGDNWTTQYNVISDTASLEAVYFTTAQTGFAAGWWTKLLKTTNGGQNWVMQPLGLGTNYFTSISFPSVSTGYISGWYKAVLKTTDGGISWNNLANNFPININFEDLHFPSNETGWVAGSSRIYRTTNGGLNWIDQSLGISTVNFSVWFVNDMTGWHVGSSGTIYKTTDGGGNIVRVRSISEQAPKDFILYQNYPNPFNPSSNIKFSIGIPSGQMSNFAFVNLKVYDVLGKEVVTLVSEQLKPGTYEVEFNGSNYPSGVYFYQFKSQYFNETKKMILLK